MTVTREQLIKAGIKESRISENEPMSAHTSFRTGGTADWFVTAENEDELAGLLSFLSGSGTNHILIGNGSNLLFPDDGYRGVVVKLGGSFEDAVADGERIRAGAAALLSRTSRVACENGLSGMAFAGGIPGSIGGAVFMNAGAYGGEMKDIVESVSLMKRDGSERYEVSGADMGFGYRTSALQDSGDIVTAVTLRLEPGDKDTIAAEMRELTEKRNSKQPVNFPSAGSTFKRPAGGFAAALIEAAGLKGLSVGGAQVSEKHSGFIINTGGATSSDVIALMEIVRDRVYENSGIMLEPEVRIIWR